MSYILDALRRADAERERGSVPGLHTQAVEPGGPVRDVRSGPKPWVWMLVGMLLVLVLAGVWQWLSRDGGAQMVAAAPVAAPVAVPVSPVAPVSPITPAAPPPPVIVPPLPQEPAKPAALPAPPQPVLAMAAPAAPEQRVPSMAELPDALKRELPQLAVGGSVYSSNPANRLLILNGQPFHEGDALRPDLSIEQIKLKSAVLKFKGQRFELSY